MRRLWLSSVLVLAACAAKRPEPPVPAAQPPAATTSANVPRSTPRVREARPERLRRINTAVLASARGEATYYADKFHGRRTASGIVFRNDELYAAHRDYPFGTLVRVTNLRNQASVDLRVVDRGPNGTSERARRTIIDVSQRAARALDFIGVGRVPVLVEVLEWGSDR